MQPKQVPVSNKASNKRPLNQISKEPNQQTASVHNSAEDHSKKQRKLEQPSQLQISSDPPGNSSSDIYDLFMEQAADFES